MNKLFDKIARLAVSALMVGTILPTCTTTVAAADIINLGYFVNPTADNLNSVLDYGVFANEYHQFADMEANLAVNVLADCGHSLGNSAKTDWSEDDSNNFNYIGSVTGSAQTNISGLKFHNEVTGDYAPILLLGDSITIDSTFNNRLGIELRNSDGFVDFNSMEQLGAKAVYNFSNTTYQIKFKDAFAGMKKYATAKYSSATTVGTTLDNSGKYNVVECSAGENILNISYKKLESKPLKVSGVNGITNYSLIINVTDVPTQNANFTQSVDIDGSNYDAYGYQSGRLMFNLGSTYDQTVTFGTTNMGCILAPAATVAISGSSHNGSVYANIVSNSGAEIHQSRFNSPVVQISLSKKLDDKDPGTNKFNFVLEDGTLNANGEYQSSGTSKTIQNNGSNITTSKVYKYADGVSRITDYYYRIYESSVQNLDKIQYTFDTNSYYVKVEVDFANKTATASYYSDAAFQNEVTNPTFNNYTGKPTGSLKVTKNISGTAASTADIFKFKITLGDTTVTGTYGNVTFTNGVAEIALKGGDSITATDLPLTSYEVKETDSRSYFISEKSGDTGTILKNTTSEAIFTNTKNNIIPKSVVLQATKSFTGRTWTTDDNFVIDLLDADGTTVIDSKTATAAAPTVNFAAQPYTGAGDHTYYIAEELPTVDGKPVSKLNGITYDTTKVKVTVKVTEDAETGTLSSEVKYDGATTPVVLANKYYTNGKFDLSVTKSISGRDWNDDDSFTFHVHAEAGSPVTEKTAATATKASQVASFGTIKFEKAGTYKYDISEEIPAGATKTEDGQYVLNGVVYDSITHVVTITVIDNGDGTLTATSDAGTSLKVTNNYTDIKFNKYDSKNNQLSGANLALYEDGSDTALDTWTSSADAERLGDYLVRGHSYVIRELSAPAGYGTFEDIKFTLNADGTVTGLESLTKDASGAYKLIDAVLDVKFVKETTDGTALSGASLELLDADGKVVDQWVSDDTAHVAKGLTAGAKYTLHEVSAPERYIVAEDITFTVENTKAAQTITMTDEQLVTPFNPDTPDKPDTPTTPDRPTTPNTPDRPTTPNTGDQTNAVGAAGALAFSMLLAGFAFFFRRKYSD